MTIGFFHRGRFWVLRQARAEQVNNNTWSVRIPVEELSPILREPIELSSLDGAVFGLGELEAEHAIGHKLEDHALHVTVWVL